MCIQIAYIYTFIILKLFTREKGELGGFYYVYIAFIINVLYMYERIVKFLNKILAAQLIHLLF